MAEFLPLCDVLFNVISLAGYFCDVVFDVVMGYALLERGYKATFAAAMSIIVTSLVITQILSWRWYVAVLGADGRLGRGFWLPTTLHWLQLGVLWRYARLFVPVEPRHVKHQVRDLCMLRLVHAFVEAAPMLLLQLHVLLTTPELEPLPDGEPTRDEPAANKAFAELNVISASLSLFSVCWALASFSKNVRLQNVHRLVLTWLGVIFQFLWRLGTISARMCALTVYALAYEYWVFLVIGLHWVSMFLWLISPKNVFHGERISKPRKAYLSALIAFVYVFAYVNLQELNHRQKMVTFYCVMCVENCLLVGAWAAAGRAGGAGGAAPLFTLAAQAAGLLFMRAYYRYFHVRRLGYMLRENQQGTNSTNASLQNKNGKQLGQGDNAAIPGVFNCRFSNPVGSAANGRKKKKPTSFVPPPAAPALPAAPAAAFWRRPLPTTHNHHGGSSENEGSSVGSRVNIQQKLQEKKQKQLAELRVIEEEIKQGKLVKTTPVAVEEIYSSLQRQPIPRAKTHAEPPAWPSIELAHSYQNYPVLPHTCNIYPTYTEIKTYDFQTPIDASIPAQELNDPLKRGLRLPPRSLYGQDNSRTFYENPANIRTDVNRTPLRNYLALGENRNYENGCGSPRNVLNNSPRAYVADISSPGNSYEIPTTAPLDKPRIPAYEGDYSVYSENNNQNYSKDDYILQNNALIPTGIENIRTYAEPNNPTLGERALYPGLHGKSKLEQLRKMQRCRTPEILLAPHYLEGCSRPVCCRWDAPAPYNMSRKKEEGAASSGEESSPEAARETPRPPSDIESQISLPRSYTLPREFRYWRRRPRLRDNRVPSNNSSDGDVDSGDNDSDRRSNCSAGSQLQSPPYTEGYAPYPPVHRLPDRSQDHPVRSQEHPARSQDENGLYSGCDRRRRGFRKQVAKPETKL